MGDAKGAAAGRDKRARRTAADLKATRHNAASARSGNIEDINTVQDCCGARLACLARYVLKVRLQSSGQGRRRQVGVAKFEHPRRKPKEFPVIFSVAVLDERQEVPPRGRACQSRQLGDLSQTELWPHLLE